MYHSRSHQPSMEISVRKWKPLLYSLCLMVPMHRFLIDLFFFLIISVGSYSWSCLLTVLSLNVGVVLEHSLQEYFEAETSVIILKNVCF